MNTTRTRARIRTGMAAIGAAAVLVAGIGAVGYASNGDALLLGKGNKSTKSTKITNKKSGPVLKLKTKSGPALSVNTTDKIANLNADLLDGKSVEVIDPMSQLFAIGTAGATGTGVPTFFQTTTLPAGTYEFFMGGTVSSTGTDSSSCAIIDVTRLLANPTDIAAIFMEDTVEGSIIGELSGHYIGDVVAGHRIVFGCNFDTATMIVQPAQFTVRKLDNVGPVTGVAPTTVPKSAKTLD